MLLSDESKCNRLCSYSIQHVNEGRRTWRMKKEEVNTKCTVSTLQGDKGPVMMSGSVIANGPEPIFRLQGRPNSNKFIQM